MSEDKLTPAQQQLVRDNLPLVKRLASGRVGRRAAYEDRDDLKAAGNEGLCDAVLKKGELALRSDEEFQTYASVRIRGAMKDFLRSKTAGSRAGSKLNKQVHEKIRESAKDGTPLTYDEALEIVGKGKDCGTISSMLQVREGHSRILSLDDPRMQRHELAGGNPSPEEQAAIAYDRQRIAKAVGTLPPREQQIIQLYYGEGRTLKEIGGVLGIAEGHVSRLHKRAIEEMRQALDDKRGGASFSL